MIKQSAYISITIIILIGTLMAILDTLLSRLILDFCYIAMGFWFGYAMTGGFDGK
jgi:hypothetical protein